MVPLKRQNLGAPARVCWSAPPCKPCIESWYAGGLPLQAFSVFFYSNEGNPCEPVHVHVRSGGVETKFWLIPQVRVATSYGFNATTLRELAEVAQTNSGLIERAWNDYFG